jgi:pilus assembly protein CpaC
MMTRITSRRYALILFLTVAGSATVSAGNGARATVVEPDETGTVKLLVGRSAVVNTNTAITRVSLTSADIADALVTTPHQLLIQGKVPGTISMFVWDRSGGMTRYNVTVERDLSTLESHMRELFPGEQINVVSNGKSVVVSGSVSKKFIADKAIEVAAGHVEKKDDVVNMLQVKETRPPQVLLRVRFAEVSRSALTELGASFFTSPLGVNDTIGRVSTGQFPAVGFEKLEWTKAGGEFGDPVTSSKGEFAFSDFLNVFLFNKQYDLGLIIRALNNKGLFQMLAEPNLVAETGKEASFLAGGEFPVPVAQAGGANIAISIMYKEFGVRLNFTPTVTGENRVRLKVKPEVSSLDFANAVILQGFRIPALSTRRTETELELDNGQTFAVAGLLNNTMTESMQKVPGIGDIPILGYLFRSKAAQKNRTELVVMITPEILPQASPGVTTETPRMQEPLLGPLPTDKQIPMPGAAFTPSGDNPALVPRPRGSADAKPATPTMPAPTAAEEAAAVLRARTPKAPTMMSEPGKTAAPAAARTTTSAPAAATPAAPTGAAPATRSAATAPAVSPHAATSPAATVAPSTAAAKPLTKDEMKRLEKAREEERKAEEKRLKEEEKAAKQAKKDAEKAMKDVEKAAKPSKQW